MVSFPKYKIYKDSKTVFEEIPAHWDTVRLGYISDVIDPQPDHRAPAIANEGGFPYIGIRDVNQDGSLCFETARQVVEKAIIKQEKSFSVEPKDILFGKVGTLGQPKHIKPHGRFAISATLVLIKGKKNINRDFLKYALDSNIIYDQIECFSNGATRPALGIQQVRKILLAIPSVDEQQRISEFLDRKTAEIDQAIEQKQRLIKLLKEQKAILIDRAFTKGLNPNVPMRDNGIDWIGEIPKHWNISKIGFVASVTKLTGFEYTSFWKTDEAGEIIALRGFNIGERTLNLENTEKISLSLSHKLKRSRLKKGDLVVPCTGTLGNASVINFDEKYHINQNIAKVSIKNTNLLPSFLCYWMTSNLFREKIDRDNVSGMQPVLLIGSIRKLAVVLPSVEEQELITQELDKENQSFDVLINKESEFIEILKELKSIIISNSVMGKIKI